MPRQLALIIYVIFILWLFIKDQKLCPMTSWALWIPLLWIIIIGSRPFSLWFGGGVVMDTPEAYLDGSPVDRNFFLILIILGLMVLLKRRVNWSGVFADNRWFFVFIIYCGISVIWSDHPFVGFKRWIKDVGNVIIVLIILTEKDPVQAIRAVFARYTYLAVPLSVLFIKYFPEIGRYYNNWTWELSYGGVTLEKNALGAITFICGIYLVWDLIETHTANNKMTGKMYTLGRALLLIMVVWIMLMVNSATSLVCLILGTCILIFIRRPRVIRQVRYLGTYSLMLSLVILLVYSVPGIMEGFVDTLGRNMTFTGRTDLWADLLKMNINPIIGTGYQSFWLGPHAEYMWNKYYFHPNQAHNGFLETYLNGGLAGVLLLMAMLISTGSKLKKELLRGNSISPLCFSFFVVVLVSNWTEATFNRQTLVWIILIIATLTYRYTPEHATEYTRNTANGDINKGLFKGQSNVSVSLRHVLYSYNGDK